MTARHDKSILIGFALAAFGTLLFSLKSIFIKYLYLEGLDAHSVLTLRMALSLPLYAAMLGYLWQRGAVKTLTTNIAVNIILLGFLGYYLASLLDLISLQYITAQLERLGLFTYPFMVAIIGALFFKTPITRRLWIALVMTYFGLWLVMVEELSLTGNNVIRGTLFVLGSAFSFALYVLFSKRHIQHLGAQVFTSIAMLASCGFGLLHGAWVLDWSALSISNTAWLWLILLVVLSTVIPSFMMAESIRRIGPAQTGVMGTLGPVFTIFLAVQLLDEPFSTPILIGVLLMLAGVLQLVWRPS